MSWHLLLGAYLTLLLPAVAGAAAAVVAIALVGPRDPDSLILPGMAATGSAYVAFFELEGYVLMAAVGLVVAFLTAIGQRWAVPRLDPAASWWPWFQIGSAVTAGALVGGFLGYFAGRRDDPELIVVGAALGGVLGAAGATRWGRGQNDTA